MSHGFFTIISRQEFEQRLAAFPLLSVETVPLAQAAGRVLGVDLIAAHDWPLEDRSCMDGIAVNARDVFGATEGNPGYLECVGALSIDQQPEVPLNPGECVRITTGGLLPPGADGVVMVEHTGEMDGTTIEIRKSVAPGENVMRRGEDAVDGAPVLKSGAMLRPQEIGLAAALGFAFLDVGARPRVGILSTGDELIPLEQTPRPGQVRDVNSHTLAALAVGAGALPKPYGIIRDELESLRSALAKALSENDVVLLSGGSSIGVRDLTVQAIESLPESEILAHGVALSPGKPTILGRVKGKPVIGLPGQVTSALVVMHVLVLPLLRHLQGDVRAFDSSLRPTVSARLARNVASKPGREDYIRIRLEKQTDGSLLAHPVLGKSGLLRTMIQAHGLAVIPAEAEGLYRDATVSVWLL
ncbi:gephyrin-like molybdotransferase Glp [Pseudodesulfovibrio tunisiensis]|uniref:molybdopterin molybdotransferase MoeA n=1 Tax=Pseudodesulfovibrio tunisiensis TaxID=463192 RepID=UPI001FB53A19|nr:gephyrin-like molybdotransferase Glp [Pseudodesulfovibrio tunisiensis]